MFLSMEALIHPCHCVTLCTTDATMHLLVCFLTQSCLQIYKLSSLVSSQIPSIVNRNCLLEMMILKVNQSVSLLDSIVYEDRA
jgi:hypothetical protein